MVGGKIKRGVQRAGDPVAGASVGRPVITCTWQRVPDLTLFLSASIVLWKTEKKTGSWQYYLKILPSPSLYSLYLLTTDNLLCWLDVLNIRKQYEE